MSIAFRFFWKVRWHRRRVDQPRSEQRDFLLQSNRRALKGAREKLRLWGLTVEQIGKIEKSETVSDRMTIFAPASGVVVHKMVNEGDYVHDAG